MASMASTETIEKELPRKLNLPDAARYLCVSYPHLHRLAHAGRLPGVTRWGSRWLITREAVLWLDEHGLPTGGGADE